jgi:hypothetical protein
MSTANQVAANRSNAARSTGPRTPDGKARSAKNATRHGLRSDLPVLAGESADDWTAHRQGILASLCPSGALEQALAERVALCLWRLRRAAAYETAVTAAGLEEVGEDARRTFDHLGQRNEDASRMESVEKELAKKQQTVEAWEGTFRLVEQLPGLPDGTPVDGYDVEGALHDVADELPGSETNYFDVDDVTFLTALGVPREECQAPFAWGGWTAGMVRRGIAEMARRFKADAEKLLARARKDREAVQEQGRAEVRRLQAEAKWLRRRLREREDRLRRRRLLPDGQTLERVSRYEAHLNRQMIQALHELQRLQAARAGEAVPPPAALDVTVDAEGRIPGLLPAPDPA